MLFWSTLLQQTSLPGMGQSSQTQVQKEAPAMQPSTGALLQQGHTPATCSTQALLQRTPAVSSLTALHRCTEHIWPSLRKLPSAATHWLIS